MQEKKSAGRQPRPQKTAARRLVKALSSVKLAVSLLVLIAVGMIVATLLKNQAHARRYIYHSWWFVSLLGLFCLNLIFCTVGRWSLRLRRLGTTVTHVGVLVMVAGAVIDTIWSERGTVQLYIGDSHNACYASERTYESDGAVYETLEQAKTEKDKVQSSGFQGLIRGHSSNYLLFYRPAEKIRLPFSVHLRDFWVERYPVLVVQTVEPPSVQAFRVKIGETFDVEGSSCSITPLRYEPDFVVLGPRRFGSRSQEPKNQALELRVRERSESKSVWVFANFPGMHQDPNSDIRLLYRQSEMRKDYVSKVQLFEGGEVVASKTVEVNKPLRYAGYSIYQSDWDDIAEQYSVLEIAKDPGIPLVYLGFLLITIGVLYGFYLRPLVVKKSTAPAGARVPKT